MELIKITKNEKGEKLVSARELYKGLKIDSNFTTWFKRMCEYGFLEDEDFIPKWEESNGGRPSMDFIIKMDMAKEISMLQRSDLGKEFRKYFIEAEKKLKQLPQMSKLEMIAEITKCSSDHDKRLNVIEYKLDNRMGLTGAQARQIGKLVSARVYKRAEGIIDANGMNCQVKDVNLSPLYSDLNTNLKAYYGISIRSDIPQSKYIEACEKIEDWKESFETEKKFRDKNRDKVNF